MWDRVLKYLIISSVAISLIGCALSRKEASLLREKFNASLATDENYYATNRPGNFTVEEGEAINLTEPAEPVSRPVVVNAYRDDSTGAMIATEALNQIVVKADYKNVAERNGYLDIIFFISVPASVYDGHWQVRFQPKMFYLTDTLPLEKIYITGAAFRQAQKRGYEKYAKYFNSIIPDTVDFVKAFAALGLLDTFKERNLKEASKGIYGVTEPEAIEHYIKYYLVRANEKKKQKLGEMFARYVKTPIDTLGLRLDTIINSGDGTINYRYIQRVRASKGMKKIRVAFEGDIHSFEEKIYTLPPSDTLSFYISSITRFVDNTPLYLKQVLERRVNLDWIAFIDFESGKWKINPLLSQNQKEIERIKDNFTQVVDNKEFIADSVIITASCSPEGSLALNRELSKKRSEEVTKMLFSEIKGLGKIKDSLALKSRSIPENWERLRFFIERDSSLKNREELLKCFNISDLDKREKALAQAPDYLYLRQTIYPLLRRIDFKFFLHRRGMLKDTIHTTTIDTLYLQGVTALKERDYKKAIAILRPYKNFNTALAYSSMDYNWSALEVLEALKDTPMVLYMRALTLGRLGQKERAAALFKKALEEEPSLRYTGNLDPEIGSIIN